MPNKLDLEIYRFCNNDISDYYYGISLLMKVCRNKTLVNFLNRSETDNNKKKLIYELDKYLTTINYEPKEEEQKESTYPLQTETCIVGTGVQNSTPYEQKINREKLDDINIKCHNSDIPYVTDNLLLIISNIKVERNKLYAERASYHGELHGAKTNEDRYNLAKLIIPIQKKIDTFNLKISEILKSGKLPINDIVSNLTTKEYKRVNNLKIYINRYKNKQKKSNNLIEKESFEKKITDFKNELNQILNADE